MRCRVSCVGVGPLVCVWVRLSGACMLCVVCVHDRSTHTCLQTARHAQRSTIFRQNHHILMVPKSTLIAHITTQQYNIWLSFFWTFFLPVTENLTENPSIFPTKCSCMVLEHGYRKMSLHELLPFLFSFSFLKSVNVRYTNV